MKKEKRSADEERHIINTLKKLNLAIHKQLKLEYTKKMIPATAKENHRNRNKLRGEGYELGIGYVKFEVPARHLGD